MEQNNWLDAIVKLYPKLHLDERVIHHSNKSDKKKQKVLSWLEKIEEIHNIVAEKKDKHLEELYKEMYYKLYIIKEEDIPDSYYQHEAQIARERGRGNIELTAEAKHKMALKIIEDQKERLDKWIEYFLYDEESKSYPIWEKYWVFQGLQTLGIYNPETKKFSKREDTTVYPIPEVDRVAIFTTLNLMEQYLKDKSGPDEIRNALVSSNFKQLYEYSIEQTLLKRQNNGTEGIWIKYDQGSDYHKLRNSLQGYYTRWCTAAGENFAKKQLENGDFYVYYTIDENMEYKIPRIAIRMDGTTKIGEIRGIADNQNLEPVMIPILNEKLKEFPDRDKYFKKEHDMQYLTQIDNKVNNNIELSVEELKFLYEIEEEIEGFGYRKDPRIEEIKNKRNPKKDLSLIFKCKEQEVGIADEHEDYQNFKIWYGDIRDELISSAKNLKFPDVLVGNLYLIELTNTENLKLPDKIAGSLYLNKLKNFDYLKLPTKIREDLFLNNLTNATSVKFPDEIGGGLHLDKLKDITNLKLPNKIGKDLLLSELTNADGLKFPDKIGDILDLSSLTNAEGLKLPKYVGGPLYLSNLATAKDLKLPLKIAGDLDLSSLASTKNLILPEYVGGTLNLSSLTNVESLKFPEYVGGTLSLSSLTSAEGLKLPEYVGETLSLSSLTSAEGLKLPAKIEWSLDLSSLTSTAGLKLPDKIGKSLSLKSLTSAENLILPEYIGGSLSLSSLTSAEGLKLPAKIEWNLNLSSLTNAESLKLPEYIGRTLDLSSLTSAEGLKLPEYIGRTLDLSSLTSAEDLKLPEYVGGTLDLSSLTSAAGLKLPDKIGKDLVLRRLISAENLILPEYIGRRLDLSSLTSVEGLKLPEYIEGTLNLSSLTSAEGLKLPVKIEWSLNLSSLTSAEGLKLPEYIGNSLNLSSLTNTKDLELPEYIGEEIIIGDHEWDIDELREYINNIKEESSIKRK